MPTYLGVRKSLDGIIMWVSHRNDVGWRNREATGADRQPGSIVVSSDTPLPGSCWKGRDAVDGFGVLRERTLHLEPSIGSK